LDGSAEAPANRSENRLGISLSGRGSSEGSKAIDGDASDPVAAKDGTGAIEANVLFLHCNKNHKIAPAKGAMAFPAASLYWCRRQGWGCVEARLAIIAREEACVN
jgi:hypothetical protein